MSTLDKVMKLKDGKILYDDARARVEELKATKAPVITNTLSGASVHIEDAAELPFEKLAVNFGPVQSGSGDPSPSNVRPISGWSSVPVEFRKGKNLYDATTYPLTNGKFVSGANGGASSDGEYACTLDFVPVSQYRGKTLTLNKRTSGMNPGIAFYSSADGAAFISGLKNEQHTANTPWTFVVPDNANFMRFTVLNGTTGIQIELGSESTTYEPYNGATYTASLGSTYYGGTVDLVTGVLTVDRGYVLYDGSEDENWKKENLQMGVNFYINVPDAKATGFYGYDILCNVAQHRVDGDTYTQGKCYISGSKNLNLGIGTLISISTVDDFKTWLSTHNVQLVYILNTPQTVQLDPQTINALQGENNISAPSGLVEVTYCADTKEYISKSISVSDAVEGNFAAFDSNGNLADSSYSPSDFAQQSQVDYLIGGVGEITVDDTYSDTTSCDIEQTFVAGTYKVSVDSVTSSDTSSTTSLFTFGDSGSEAGQHQFQRGVQEYAIITIDEDVDHVCLYASNTYENSVDDTFTFTNLKIEYLYPLLARIEEKADRSEITAAMGVRVDTDAQGLTTTEQSNARTNIAAAASADVTKLINQDWHDALYTMIFGDNDDWSKTGQKTTTKKVGRRLQFGYSGSNYSTYQWISMTGTKRLFTGNNSTALSNIKSSGNADFIPIAPYIKSIAQNTNRYDLHFLLRGQMTHKSTAANTIGLRAVFRKYNSSTQSYTYSDIVSFGSLNFSDYSVGYQMYATQGIARSLVLNPSTMTDNYASDYEEVAIYFYRQSESMSGYLIIQPELVFIAKDAVISVSGRTPTITAVNGVRYVCSETYLNTLSFTPDSSSTGTTSVRFISGTTPTALTVPNTVKWPSDFDPSNLSASTTYELIVEDGIYGSVKTWT